MTQLGMNIVTAHLEAHSDSYANRLARLRSYVNVAVGDVEEIVRAQARTAGIAEEDLEGLLRPTVARAVRAAVEDVLRTQESAQHPPQVPPAR